MNRFYLIRHCAASGQAPRAPLTAEGIEQAERLSDFLFDKDIEAIWCSPFERAEQSIRPFATRANLPIRTDSRLAERVLCSQNLPNWLECLRQSFDDIDLSFEGGESSRAATQRAVAVVNTVMTSTPNLDTVALVTHGNLMALLLRHYDSSFGFDDWARLSNPDVFLITMDNVRATVDRVWA